MRTSEAQGEIVRTSSLYRSRPICGTADLGSARGPRVVFDGSPKTVAKPYNNAARKHRRFGRRGRVETLDEPSSEARQQRAHPNPENRVLA